MKVRSCRLRININELGGIRWLDWCKMVSFMKQAGLVDGFVLEIHTRILQILAAMSSPYQQLKGRRGVIVQPTYLPHFTNLQNLVEKM